MKTAVRDLIIRHLDEVLKQEIMDFPTGYDAPDAIHGIADHILNKVLFTIDAEGTRLAGG